MRKRIVMGLALTSLLCGCVTSTKYPANWAKPNAAIGDMEQAIVGDYSCVGELAIALPQIRKAYLVHYVEDGSKVGSCDVVHMDRPEVGVLEMTFYRNDRLIKRLRFVAGEDYRLENGWLVFNRKIDGVNRDGILAVSAERKSLTVSTSDDLIIKSSGMGTGLAFLIPVVAGTTNWLKFEQVPCNHR